MQLPNKLVLQYNARLKDLVQELNENLPGATFVHANVYELVMELITNLFPSDIEVINLDFQ